MPVATVILNSYNQGAYLAEAIESALGQTMEDLELLIIDTSMISPGSVLTGASSPDAGRHSHPQLL